MEKVQERFNCRLAEHSDYDDVMAIDNNVYGGYDYLEHLYHKYLEMDNVYCYVVESDSNIVAFICITVVDDGRAFIRKSGRVRKEFRGFGILHRIKFESSLFQDVHPRICRIYRTTVDVEAALKKLKNNPSSNKLLTKKARISIFINKEEFHDIMRSKSFEILHRLLSGMASPQVVSRTEAVRLLEQELPTKEFVPEGMWITGCTEPYRDLSSNYPLMVNDSSVFVTRRRTGTKKAGTPGVPDGEIMALSFLNLVPCKAGLRHRMDFYPRVTAMADEQLIVSHMIQHLCFVKKNMFQFNNYNFSFMIPEEYSQDVLRDVLTSLGVVEMKEDRCYLIQENISPNSQL